MKTPVVRVASRASRLALRQTQVAIDALRALGFESDVIEITTRGDRVQDRSLVAIGGDGVFTQELQAALLDGRADVAVHSMKDLPTQLAPTLRAGAVLERGDARDVLLSKDNRFSSIAQLPQGAIVGTSSLRRRAQLLALRPDLQVRDLRGNVDTRVRKLLAGDYDAIVLALVGLQRLELLASVGGGAPLDFAEMLPAPGQGAIYVQCRTDAELRPVVESLNHAPTARAVELERAFLSRLGGGCLAPVGAQAQLDDERWRFDGLVAHTDGSAVLRRSVAGAVGPEAEARALVERLADDILAAGGREMIDRMKEDKAAQRL